MKIQLSNKGYILDQEKNIWSRPEYGGINYSDGDDNELRISKIIEQATDLSVLSTELRQHCTDWPSLYHLSGARSNILRPFSTLITGDILEIGAGCGAITRYLGECGANVLALEGSPRRAAIARARTRGLENITVLAETFDQFQCNHKFDVITLIGVLEYANLFTSGQNPQLATLELVSTLLKPTGTLIIAIENQLGLKYFAGAPEDHLGQPMCGIEGRYCNDQPQTFGRKVMSEMLNQAGFAVSEFLAPFPDYKLPVSILTEEGIRNKAFDAAAFAWQSARLDPQLPIHCHFSLELAWPEIFKNELVLDMANSFLIIASPNHQPLIDKHVLAYHYSTDRIRAYCKETVFTKIKCNDVRVRYRRLDHPKRGDRAHNSLIKFICPESDKYVFGKLFSLELIRIVTKDGWSINQVAKFVWHYLSIVETFTTSAGMQISLAQPYTELTGDFFDVVPQNIIIREDGSPSIIDKEWQLCRPIELGHLLFRSLLLLVNSISRFSIPESGVKMTRYQFIDGVLMAAGFTLNTEDYLRYSKLEAEIQQVVTGRAVENFLNWQKDQLLPMLSLHQMVAERDEQIAGLNQAIAERNWAVAERDGQITNLNQLVAERDGQIAGLNQAMTDRDGQIASQDQALNQAVAQREAATIHALTLQNSLSWRITRPLRFMARVYRYGLLTEDKQRLVQLMRQRYYQLPLSASVKKSLRFFYHQVLGKHIRPLRSKTPSTVRFQPPTIKPAAKQAQLPDYIVWGIIDWHFRHQRPQQLALALAETGRRVFYVSADMVDDEHAGFDAERIDEDGRVFQIRLFVNRAPTIYTSAPSSEIANRLRASLGEVLYWAGCNRVVSMVQHPFWYEIACSIPNSRLVYDCMDHHEGFGNNGETLLELEKKLFRQSDLTITTSAWLDQTVAEYTTRRAMIRNAGEYEHFSRAPESVYRDTMGRRVIGYYGAIAQWFDLDLVKAVAKQNPMCCVLLIGEDTVDAKSRLKALANVTFIGEVPYNKLPYYLYSFDVCLIPFKVVPLTMATNPVKVYEYLSAGKPVVSVNLPEMAQFDELVDVTINQEQFLKAVDRRLAILESEDLIQRRKFFAMGQTWKQRAEALIHSAEASVHEDRVSIIVVTYNNLELTRACLASIDDHSQYENIEIIAVDNASSDGTPNFLKKWAAGNTDRKLILNTDNRGFAVANNQGLNIASGDYLVLLNNDTYVTPGWARTLMGHLKHDKTIGLIGPVTNNIGNEAKIDIRYDNMSEMLVKSFKYTRRHVGQLYPVRTAAFFCVMMHREIFQRVGPLDEAFCRGFFEDDDYCRRIEKLGLRVVCAEDVFIHHHLSAAFDQIKPKERQKLFEENMKIYERKWGKWLPHSYREAE